MTAELNLLPCPMPDCGSDLVGTGRLPCGVDTVCCGRCGVSVPSTDDATAVERWNRRATPAATGAGELPPLIYVRKATLDLIAGSSFVKHDIVVRTEPNDGWVALGAIASDRAQQAGAAVPSAAPADVVISLREYASNPGYSHNDYADTMRDAANVIESLRAMFYNYSTVVATPQSQVATYTAGVDLSDLWIHEDMERDNLATALKAPRKDLQAAHKQAVEDLIQWKRRALTVEAAIAQQAAAHPAPAAQAAEARALFEAKYAAASTYSPSFIRNGDYYQHRDIQNAWHGWQLATSAVSDGWSIAAAPAPAQEAVHADRDALAKAIHEAAVKVRAIAPDTVLSGPQLVSLCKDMAEAAQAQQAAAPAIDSVRIRDQITADANCILRLLSTVDKLVGGISGATESIQEHAQHIVQYAGKIAAPVATAAPAGDAEDALRRLCTHDKRTSQQIDADWDYARAVLAKLDRATTSAPAPATNPGKLGPKDELSAWREGVLMAASILVSVHDQPTMAADVLNELGLRNADCSKLDEFDRTNLRKILITRPRLKLRGLDSAAEQKGTT